MSKINDGKLCYKSAEMLKLKDLLILVHDISPSEKALIVAKTLSKYMFIKDGILYISNNNGYYDKINKEINSRIWPIIERFIKLSIDNLDKKNTVEFMEKTERSKKYLTQKCIMSYIDPFKMMITKDDIILDSYIGQIHFKNGYIDIKENVFKERDTTHYITKVIQRNYNKSSEESRNKLMTIIKRIYPDEEDMRTILMIYGSGLSGKSTLDQDMLFTMGTGSGGKSTMLEITKLSLTSVYFMELKSDIFSTSASEKNKLLNSYLSNPQILLTWINEFSTERIDISLFKNFVEGKCNTTRLYNEESCTFDHKSKILSTSQNFPNIQIDTGTMRRIKAITCKSKFVDDVSEVDESKNIYLKDYTILETIRESDELLNGWIDILVESSTRYMNGEKIKYTKNFTDSKDIVIASNDYIQDFIDSNLILTNDEKERIGKKEMHMKFSLCNPNRHLKELDIITALKEKGVKYDKGIRSKTGVRGCFCGVLFKDENKLDCDDPFENEQVFKDIKSNMMIKRAFDKNEKLNDTNKLLKNEMNKLRKSIKSYN